MTEKTLYKILSSAFPTCHTDWSGCDKVPEPPYIAYIDDSASSFGADNQVYYKANNYTIELYIRKGDTESENKLEQTFDSNKIFYEKAKIWIKDINLYQVIYNI